MDFEQKIAESLKLEIPYLRKLEGKAEEIFLRAQREGNLAAVLVLFGFFKGENRPHLLLTRRADTVESHKGQVAFPGGMRDPEDNRDPDADLSTALRETHEEVGIAAQHVRPIGKLPPLSTLSTRIWVTPIVGVASIPINELPIQPNRSEIERVFWVSWEALCDDRNYEAEELQFHGIPVTSHTFHIEGERVWGATAAMIKNLIDRIKPAT